VTVESGHYFPREVVPFVVPLAAPQITVLLVSITMGHVPHVLTPGRWAGDPTGSARGLFRTAKLWKQPRCPMMDENVLYVHIMEFYSPIKKNKNMLFASKWMELENFMLCEASQALKVTFSLICGS
jgi:hypothetical protein